jgi:LacI family transcriptional regulator
MGITAARTLLDRIRGHARVPDLIPIIPELVIRESTAPPRQGGMRKRRN